MRRTPGDSLSHGTNISLFHAHARKNNIWILDLNFADPTPHTVDISTSTCSDLRTVLYYIVQLYILYIASTTKSGSILYTTCIYAVVGHDWSVGRTS